MADVRSVNKMEFRVKFQLPHHRIISIVSIRFDFSLLTGEIHVVDMLYPSDVKQKRFERRVFAMDAVFVDFGQIDGVPQICWILQLRDEIAEHFPGLERMEMNQ